MALSELHQRHDVDEHGNPAGGVSNSVGLQIEWQNGPLRKSGDAPAAPNGAFVENVIAAAIGRIQFYQQSRFHCIENAIALGHLRVAAEILAERTRDRERRGVEGTHQR